MLFEPHLWWFVVAEIGNQYIKGKCYIKETPGKAEEAQKDALSLSEVLLSESQESNTVRTSLQTFPPSSQNTENILQDLC